MLVFTAMAVLLTVMAGCGGSGTGNVTVKDPPNRETGGKMELVQIERKDDLYGLAWLSDTEIISTRKPLWMEGMIYVHSQGGAKGPDRELGIHSALTVNPSPDRTHLFVSNRMNASFVQIADGKRVSLDVSDETYSGHLNGDVRGAWIGENAYLLVTTYGLSVAGIHGDTTLVWTMKEYSESILKVEAVPDLEDPNRFKAYFLDQRGVLYKMNVVFDHLNHPSAKGEPQQVRTKVVDFSVSADGSKLAVAVETSENKNTVYLMETGTPDKATVLAEGRLAKQISWSPDGSKLAYSLFNLERGGSGLYVMDTKEGRTALVSLYPNLQSMLTWSPDGNRLMMSQENPEMNLTTERTKLMTEIYRFK
jgi:hypothetical protein